MVKRGSKGTRKQPKKSSKGRTTKIIHESTREVRVDKSLTDNFIALQRVMVNLSVKFDSLSSQIARLLEVFEISAKNLARKDYSGFQQSDIMQPGSDSTNRKIIEKLDTLAEQAGLIGKGLALIHEVNTQNGTPTLSTPRTAPIQAVQQQTQIKMPVQQPRTFVSPLPSTTAKPLAPKKPGLEEISSELSGFEKSETNDSPFDKP